MDAVMTRDDGLIDETAARLNTHEAVCAQRYEDITKAFGRGEKRMQKIEWMLYAVMALVLLGPGVAAEFIKKILELH
jgi:hypothetical protein